MIDLKMSVVVKLADEVLNSEGHIEGWDSLRGIFEHGKESDPQYVFGTTYPIVELKSLLEAVDAKLKGMRRTGFFEVLGGYGTGKSRILVFLWHLFMSRDLAKEWLKENAIAFDPPTDATVLAFNLLDSVPAYLWEPIFQGLGREDLIKRVEVFPGYELLREALVGKGVVVIIMDELESWYKSVRDKDANLNFLQVLAEIACDEKFKLLVFCSLYGETPDLLARLDRVKPYRVNLTLSEDRHKIVLFRLFKSVDKGLASKIVSNYMKYYSESEVEVSDPPMYEERMTKLYPIHPELMKVLLTRYSSSPNYQNTRGVLCLLGSVVFKKFQEVDMLLTSDVDMSERELLSLDRVLTENAQKDAEEIGKEDAKKLLNVILLYSFGETRSAGASRDDVILGILRPGININDVDSLLSSLPSMASHVWLREDRYVIGREENVITVIQNKALENVSRGKIEDALALIKAKLRKDPSYVIYHPDERYRDPIEDDEKLKVVVSLKTLTQSEINEFYKGKEFANRLIFYMPKSGDLTIDEDLLVVAERLRLCDQYEEEVSGENKMLLEDLRWKDDKLLKDKLSDVYGYWARVMGYEKGEVKYRLIQCGLDAVKTTVKKSYDVETVRSEILKHLERREKGVRIEDIKYDFKTTPGKPILVVEEPFYEAVKTLYEQSEISIEHKGVYMRHPERLPPIKDDMKIVLIKYAPQPPERMKGPEEEGEPEAAIPKPLSPIEAPKTREPVEKIEERPGVKLQTIETSEYTTPYNLSVEVERKIPEDAKVRQMRLDFSEASFKDVEALKTFITNLSYKRPKISNVSLTVVLEGPLHKKDITDFIDKFPSSLGGGKVKAVIEVESFA
jgi:hypothetical protein